MNNLRYKFVFILAIGFGLITAFLVLNYLQDVKEALDDTDYVEIVVANQDIPEKSIITASMVTLKKIPLQYMHPQETTNKNDIVDKILLVPVTAGESILKNQVLDKKDSKEGLAYMIPKGKRALTVAVDEVSGVSGLIQPGDRVDVISTVVIGEREPKPYTLVVLQDIQVLAVGKAMDKKPEVKTNQSETKTVTLAVTLSEAKPLMMASQRGVIRLMLRSPIDDSKGYTPPFTMEDFLAR